MMKNYIKDSEIRYVFNRNVKFIKNNNDEGSLILVGDDKIIKVWQNKNIIHEIDNEEFILSIKINNKLSKLFVGGFSYLKIYDIEKKYKLIYKIQKKNLGINKISFFKDLILISDGDILYFLNYLENYKIIKKINMENNINTFKIIDKYLFISDNNLHIYNLENFEWVKSIDSNKNESYTFIKYENKKIYTNENKNIISILDLETLQIIKSVKIEIFPLKVILKNNFLYFSNLNYIYIANINIDSFEIIQKLNLNNNLISEFKLINDNIYIVNNDKVILKFTKEQKKLSYKKSFLITAKNEEGKSKEKKIIKKIKKLELKLNNLEYLIKENQVKFQKFQKFQNKILESINCKLDNFDKKIDNLKNQNFTIKDNNKANNYFSPNIKIKTKNILNQTINKSFDYTNFKDSKIKKCKKNDNFLKIVTKKIKQSLINKKKNLDITSNLNKNIINFKSINDSNDRFNIKSTNNNIIKEVNKSNKDYLTIRNSIDFKNSKYKKK